MTTERRWVHGFGVGRVGAEASKTVLGGKGAGLAEMSRLGIPVPPGFTLSTELCAHYQRTRGRYPEGLEAQVEDALRQLERATGKGFGEAAKPLLVSVRSGAPISMPGMMDTVLNLGMNRDIVERHRDTERERFLLDCHRRLLSMYGDVVLRVPTAVLERPLRDALAETGSESEQKLPVSALRSVCERLAEAVRDTCGSEVPEDPHEQLWGAIGAVFGSWSNARAVEYRRLHGIPDDVGTAVNVQAMVFGNYDDRSASGVAFTRSPSTGERVLFGEYLVNAQGEDVVAGTHTPRSIQTDGEAPGLEGEMPDAYRTLCEVAETLEGHFRDMQDLEFTVEHGELYLLQTRTGKRSGPAAVRIAVSMVDEGLIDRATAVRRVEPAHLVQMLAPVFDEDEREQALASGRLLARGLAAGPGAASGRIAFSAERAAEMARNGAVLLVRDETSPEDILGMYASAGILTTRGGMTSHAAVVARGLGKPCVVGAAALRVDHERAELHAGDLVLHEGDELSIDGTRGEVVAGSMRARPSQVLDALRDGAAGADNWAASSFQRILEWADGERRLGVRANADTPADAQVARLLGAEGIGLCRTEHMFFEEERIPWVRQLIVARDDRSRGQALEKLLPMQQSDFEAIFRALAGLPVTVRLLDPPLHEFLPATRAAMRALAERSGLTVDEIAATVESLREVNPMLGRRGCRLGITFPEIYRMQTRALARAACRVASAGIEVRPEVMIPLTGTEAEMARLRGEVESVLAEEMQREGVTVPILIGTMIEVPRAALVADRIARHSDFFSFGTNDLTQMTFGYSRDDVGSFLPAYVEQGIVPFDPFARIDQEGVGELVRIAVERGRAGRPTLKLGVCGEHGGEPSSVAFFDAAGLDYVSCSPYRVPVARLAAARARLLAVEQEAAVAVGETGSESA